MPEQAARRAELVKPNATPEGVPAAVLLDAVQAGCARDALRARTTLTSKTWTWTFWQTKLSKPWIWAPVRSGSPSVPTRLLRSGLLWAAWGAGC